MLQDASVTCFLTLAVAKPVEAELKGEGTPGNDLISLATLPGNGSTLRPTGEKTSKG